MTCPSGIILLPLVEERCMPMHGWRIGVMKVSKQLLLLTDLEAPVSCRVEIFCDLLWF